MSDLISRQALMKEFSDFVRASNNSDFAQTPTWNDAVSLVGSMPSVQPTQPNASNALKTLDCIDRQEAIDALAKFVPYAICDASTESYTNGLTDAYNLICQLPAVQPQPEIIRCKDCKYWREHKYAKETKRYIPFCGFNAINTKADDYCSFAERRTDER